MSRVEACGFDPVGFDVMVNMDEKDYREKLRKCPYCSQFLRINDDGRCHECGTEVAIPRARPHRLRFLSLPHMRYPNAYVWLVFVSALDIFLTVIVLFVWRGYEVNPIVSAIIDHLGFHWAIVFKFSLIALVIIICEVVGRQSERTGRKLAIASIIVSALPVAYTFVLLFRTGPAPVE